MQADGGLEQGERFFVVLSWFQDVRERLAHPTAALNTAAIGSWRRTADH
jgi:hypothetical protein